MCTTEYVKIRGHIWILSGRAHHTIVPKIQTKYQAPTLIFKELWLPKADIHKQKRPLIDRLNLPQPCMNNTYIVIHSFIHSFIHSLACAERYDSLPFSGASSLSLCCVHFPSTQFHQLVFRPSSLLLSIYFAVYLSALLFPKSYITLFWEFYFLPFYSCISL